MVFAVVTGGGTSGHVVPALAVMEALVDAGHLPGEIAYAGSRRGVESSMVPQTGVQCAFLPVTGLQRSLSPRAVLSNIAFPFRLAVSRLMAGRLLRRWSPRVVVSVGGYASEPLSRAAVAAGVPLVCVSYDMVPGLATRRQSRRAVACAVAFEGSGLPRAVVTGAPVRRSVRTMDPVARRAETRAERGIDDGCMLVTVVGGSLGSAALNSCVPALAAAMDAAGVRARIIHVTGRRYADTHGSTGAHGSTSTGSTGSGGNVTVDTVAYEDDMPSLLAATDVLVSRAGASTVAEVAAIGVAAVFVPWPGAADDHQTRNAGWLSAQGAATTVHEGTDLPGGLPHEVSAEVVRLCLDPGARHALATRARDAGAVHRGTGLVDLITDASLA